MYKILIVDDDHIMSKVMSRMFASEKYDVKLSHTAKDAMETCVKELPDLVILDINLPDGNGLDMCKEMKDSPRLKHIPVIMLTGDATTVDNKIQGLEYGAEDYILKPFIATEMLARVAGILKRSFPKGE